MQGQRFSMRVSASETRINTNTVVYREEMRSTRGAVKRAAMDDCMRGTSLAPAPHAKKRPALANLSNQYPLPSSSQAPIKNTVVGVSTCAEKKKGNAVLPKKRAPIKIKRRSSCSHVLRERNTVSNFPCEPMQIQSENKPVSNQKAAPVSGSTAVIDSLERKTLQSLYISRAPEPCLSEGDLPDPGGCSKSAYIDIDINHLDPQMCTIYANELYEHVRVAELKRRPATDFMEVVQQDITSSMRGVLVDWLVEVAEEYKLVPDTLYLTISYIDRFLSGNSVRRQKLQLLGVTCMLIASKYEEICAPQVEELCYITDNTYSRDEVLRLERRVLNYLHFELTTPTTKTFLRRFVRAAQAESKVNSLQLSFLANYLAELTLLGYDFLKYLPSLIAASAVFMAKLTLDPQTRPWTATLQHYTGYRPSELEECVQAIHDMQRNTRKCTLSAVREKYRQHKFKFVANLVPPAALSGDYFCTSDS